MKKIRLIISLLVLMLVSEACGQAYEEMRGTSVDTFLIGNKYWFELFRDKDSTQLKYKMSVGVKDSIFIFADRKWVEAKLNNFSEIINIDSLLQTINYTQAQLLLKSNKTHVDSVQSQLQSSINLKATTASLDTLRDRLEFAEGELAIKAGKTELKNVRDSLYTEVYLRARAVSLDSVKNRMSTAEAGITANANQIIATNGTVSNIQSSLFLYALKDNIIGYINITPETIKISANKIELDGDVIATKLSSKTIISPIIKSAESSTRIEWNSLSNGILFYNSSGNTIGSIYADPSGASGVNGQINFSSGISVAQRISSSSLWTTQIYIGGVETITNARVGNFLGLNINGELVATQNWAFANFLSSESDPVFNASASKNILQTNINSWDNAVDWISEFTESDPTISAWAKASTKPSYAYSEITGTPTLFSGSYTDLTNKPTLFSGSYTDLTNKPNLFSGSYTDLTNKPTLFSGSYTDLTNKPSIPAISISSSDHFMYATSTSNVFGKYITINGVSTEVITNIEDL